MRYFTSQTKASEMSRSISHATNEVSVSMAAMAMRKLNEISP